MKLLRMDAGSGGLVGLGVGSTSGCQMPVAVNILQDRKLYNTRTRYTVS